MPLESLQLHGVRVLVDREATRAGYTQVTDPGCDCCYCENFRATMDQLFRPDLVSVLDQLGIDRRKPAEIIQSYRLQLNAHLYEVMYHLVGELPEQKGVEVHPDGSRSSAVLDLNNGLQISFSTLHAPTHPVFDRARAVLISVFFDGVPWVNDHPEPE